MPDPDQNYLVLSCAFKTVMKRLQSLIFQLSDLESS